MQENCSEVIFSSDAPFQRLEHYKLHEYTKKWNQLPSNNNLTPKGGPGGVDLGSSPKGLANLGAGTPPGPAVGPPGKETVNMTLSTNLDSMFKRKRGRPPKNRVVEVSHVSV